MTRPRALPSLPTRPIPRRAPVALAGVSPKAYGDEAKRQADLAKTGAETRAKQLETAHKQIDLAGQAFGYVRQFPTKDNAVAP
jgi:hypothetical protein